MPYEYKLVGSYHEDNPFKVGDKIKKKGEDEEMRVGDDWGELIHWGGRSADKTHIVTTCGRVLSIDQIIKI
jgi:hypothetical protein